jgi:hypothetical protein
VGIGTIAWYDMIYGLEVNIERFTCNVFFWEFNHPSFLKVYFLTTSPLCSNSSGQNILLLCVFGPCYL